MAAWLAAARESEAIIAVGVLLFFIGFGVFGLNSSHYDKKVETGIAVGGSLVGLLASVVTTTALTVLARPSGRVR